jgi:aminoglycoside phosphotransferase (APT) family kinase protein
MEPGSAEYEKALDEFIELRRRTFYPKTDLPLSPEALKAALDRKSALGESLRKKIEGAALDTFGRAPLEVEFVAAGTFHLVYRIIYSTEERYFLKAEAVFTERPAFEFEIEEALSGRKVAPGVRIIRTDFSRGLVPLDYQMVSKATGVRLTELENPETQFVPDAVLEDWGRTLARVHQVAASGAGLLNPRALRRGEVRGALSSWEEYLRLNLSSHLETCRVSGAISEDTVAAIEGMFDRAVRRLGEVPMCLLHGDPGHHNVFARDEKISAVIDWEDALAGDPIFDVAYWGTFVRDYLREPFLRGYREINALPEDFEFRYWLYYLRVAISKTAHRHLFGYEDRPGRPPAAERIHKAVSHLGSLTR